MCDYCRGKKALIESPAAGVCISDRNMKMLSYYATEETVFETINFCPMCGRKLSEARDA